MYTLKIQFNKGGKVYHFASMRHMGTGKCYVESGSSWGNTTHWKREEVYIVGHEPGISPKATKWRTGAVVTHSQRLQYPYQPVKEESSVEKVTLTQLQDACGVFKKLGDSSGITYVGFSREGQVYYQVGRGEATVSVEPTAHNLRTLLSHANTNSQKAKLQEDLQELLHKAEEIKAQIEEL